MALTTDISHAPAVDEASGFPASVRGRREGPLRVLLVEDSRTDAAIVTELLEQGPLGNVAVSRVERVDEARERLAKESFDVLLVDLQLPDARGIEAVVRLRAQAKAMPLVVLTGSDDEEVAMSALRCEADDYLEKRELTERSIARAIRYSIERRKWHSVFRYLIEKHPDAAVLVDAEGRVFLSNPAASELLGIPQGGLEAKRFPFAIDPDDVSEVEVATGVVAEMRSARIEWYGADAYLVSLHDVTSRKRSEESLRKLAIELTADRTRLETLVATDPLTGILNRRGLEQMLESELSRVNRYGAALTSILVDCDNFKEINANYGYGGGDAVLVEIANRLRGIIRATDRVGRIGGDEFLLLLPETRLAEAMVLAERVRVAIGSPAVKWAGEPVRVTVSIGIAAVPEACTVEEIFWLAQRALTKSKRHGKNRVMVETDASAEPESVSGHAGARVEELLSRPEWFATVAQPIYTLDGEHVIGHELLTRLRGGDFTGIHGLFMAALGRNSLVPLDLQCLRVALKGARRRAFEGRLHVNLFPSTIVTTPADLLIEMLRESGAPSCFCVEIGEHELIRDHVKFRDQILALRKLGVQIALDDVGFGKSSLEALVVLEPDIVKLDRRCIEDVLGNPNRARQLTRLMRVVESLDATAIAVGIESRDALAVLRDIGITLGQGFLWGKPDEL